MKIPRSQVAPVLAGLTLKPDADTKQLSREIAAYLLDESRTGELDSLMRDVVASRADEGIVEVTAISAHELSDGVRQDIEKLVREQFKDAKQIIINQRIDVNLIGGVRLELIDRQVDMSIRNKLNRFKERAFV